MIMAATQQPPQPINEEAMVSWAIRRIGVGHVMEREDAMQEGRIALAKAMQRANHAYGPHAVRGYLFNALRHRMIAIKRDASAACRTGYVEEFKETMAAAQDTDVVRRFEQQDARTLIERAPLYYRERIVLLRILDGELEQDLARELGITRQGLNAIKQKAIKAVRRAAKRSGEYA